MVKCKLLLIIIFGSAIILQAQKFTHFSADFSIIQKNTLTDSSYLIVGNVEYDLSSDLTHYAIQFPEKKFWEFKDSTLTVYDSLHFRESIDTVGAIQDYSLFRKFLTEDFSDFDLEREQFSIDSVEKADSTVLIKWKAPPYIEFIDVAYTQKVKGKLKGVIFTDVDGKDFSKSFFEDYVRIHDKDIPRKIKSYFQGKEEEIFRVIDLRNIEIW